MTPDLLTRRTVKPRGLYGLDTLRSARIAGGHPSGRPGVRPGAAPRPAGGRRAARRGRRAPGRRPSPRAGRPTTVCRADAGPQRSHASTGSDSAPANLTPSSPQTTRSPHAPTDSSPISPARPRQAAPPRVAISRASRADIEPAPWRSLPCSIAVRASSHSDAESADAEPSHAQPDRRTGGAQLGDRRQPAAQDHVGRRAVRRPDAARRPAGRPRRRRARPRGPARSGRSASRRRRGSRPAGGRTARGRTRPRPAVSHRWVCSRTSSRSASSAVRVISDVETLNGEHGASAIRVIAGGDRSWCAATRRSRVGQDLVVVLDDGVRRQPAVLDRQRHRAAGRVEPHAEVAGGGDLGRDQVAGAARVHVEVVGRGGAAAQRQLGQPDVGADVGGLLVQPRPQRVERDAASRTARRSARARTRGSGSGTGGGGC